MSERTKNGVSHLIELAVTVDEVCAMLKRKDMDCMQIIDVCSVILEEIRDQCQLSMEEMETIIENRMFIHKGRMEAMEVLA